MGVCYIKARDADKSSKNAQERCPQKKLPEYVVYNADTDFIKRKG